MYYMHKYITAVRFGCLAIGIFFSLNLSAQGRWEEEGEIKDAEIIIEKDKKLELPAASRNFEKVPPLPQSPSRTPLNYQFQEFNFQLKPIEPQIRVLTMQDDKLSKLYGNYLKMGFGNYGTPYLETFLNSKRDKNYLYGLHYRHISSTRGPVAEENSASSSNRLNLYGKAISKNISLGTNLFYDRQMVHFYGYNPIWNFESDSIKQTIQRMGIAANLDNNKIGAKTDYKLNTQFEYLKDRYTSSEINFDLAAQLEHKLSDKMRLGVESSLWLSNYQSTTDINRTLFKLLPTAQFELVGIKLKAGLNLVYENDTLPGLDQLHAYPFVKADYSLTEGVKAYALVDGDIQKNNLSNALRQNPFLVEQQVLGHTNKKIGFQAGLKGKLLSTLGFNAGFSSGRYQNMQLINLSATDTSRFDLVYDQGIAIQNNFYGELSFNKEEKFRSTLRGDYFKYSMDQQAKAWHRPEYSFSWMNTFNIYNKVLVNTDTYVMGGINALSPSGESVELNPIFDINVKFDYMFTPRASAFLSVQNMLSKNYERYLNYPVRGAQVLVGFSFTF